MNQDVLEKLKKIGVYLHRGGFAYDPILILFSKIPLVVIWHESEEPTAEEMETLKDIVLSRVNLFGPSAAKDFTAEGANTITLRKNTDGQWTFRELTWEVGPIWFTKPGTLKEIAQALQ